jgi:four helix bundle protein
MLKTQKFQDLIVWQKAHKFTLEIYKITKQFPKEEVYGLTSQMRRSAVSVSANVAEGYKKRGKLDKARFLNISEGSLDETKYYLILCKDLNYISSEYDGLYSLAEEVSKLLNAYSNAIKTNM